MLRRTALTLLLAAPFALRSAPAQPAPLTVVVVRHAEKGPENPDPSLTEAGARRAAELARVLQDLKPAALFASEFKRTQETVRPLAAGLGLTPTVIPAGNLDDLVKAILALPEGSRSVVASHSNLVHVIVARLSGVQLPQLTEADYDRLVVVTVTGPGKGSAVVLRYGDR